MHVEERLYTSEANKKAATTGWILEGRWRRVYEGLSAVEDGGVGAAAAAAAAAAGVVPGLLVSGSEAA